ncbi:ferrous iron transport protein A [Pseudodesulfovibrio sp. JC047]|uniref:FeoA family protein n=1 Tax=Pseudodesulfovibrio sp. JC047 TaxID=2683199 RepID=UPI0013D12EF9|nr:FeoA family protein [Pseudodesulfovibrio sp. JC047]NDV18418.1 ferrous iron transport protein A [Pseudodesulfovibrio sp. JC047]
MYTSLTHAPTGVGLTISRITDPHLESRMGKMGLFVGGDITRLDEDVALQTVRVKGPKGEVVLGGGMGVKVVTHLDDGRMIPLTEMKPGETGHVECVTAGGPVQDGMEALGLKNNDPIELIRILPPMEFIAIIQGRGRIRLAEGMAAKILGRMGDIQCQFANAQAGMDFEVERILGGHRAQRAIASLDIAPGVILRLESVGKAPSYQMTRQSRCVVSSPEGLRLYLRHDQSDLVIVSYEEADEFTS